MPFLPKTNPAEILDAAIRLVRQEGLDALTMRRLAADLEIQAPSLYRHYPDQETLRQAIAEEAARLLLERLQKLKRLSFSRALMEYVAFSRQEPGLYELLVAVPQPSPNQERKKLWNYMLELVAPLTGKTDDTASAVAIWSFLHGYCSLERNGLFGPSGPQGGLERGIAALQQGLTKSPNRATASAR